MNAATGPSLRRAGIDTLFLDVFGTVVDWRTSIIDESRSFGDTLGITGVDWAVFADRWRALYQPSMNRVRRGERPWTSLDVLHRESLDTVIDEFGMGLVEADALDCLNEAWHRPAPWPDSKPGLDRLHTKYRIATCSNGSVRLLSDLARFGDLPFDIILGPPIARAYKPLPEAYLVGVELLGLEPSRCMMVAAHNADLAVAAGLGFRTAFVARPAEHGQTQTTDLAPDGPWDLSVSGFDELADRLGC